LPPFWRALEDAGVEFIAANGGRAGDADGEAHLTARKGTMIFIEHEGSLYRGVSRAWPKEVWSRRQRKFIPYGGKAPKPVEWGSEISEAEAINMMMGWTQKHVATSLPRRERHLRRR
jgi:hypothetical protein